jgi:hypothetical protein
MQTLPTHALLGATVAQAMLTTGMVTSQSQSTWVFVIIIGILGGIAPDMVMVPIFVWDKFVRKIQPMTDQGPVTMFLKEVTHSVFTWSVAGFLWSIFFPAGEIKVLGFVFVLCALFAGVIPDIYTHTEERFLETDPTFIFPVSRLIGKRLRSRKPAWEYRKAHGDLGMKEWEKVFNFIVVFFLIILCMFFVYGAK